MSLKGTRVLSGIKRKNNFKKTINFPKRNTYFTMGGFICGNSGPGMILFLAGRFTITRMEKVGLLTQASHCLLSFTVVANLLLQL